MGTTVEQACPECGASATGAPWCGACGARLDPDALAPAEDATGDRVTIGGTEGRLGRRRARLAGAAAVLVLVVGALFLNAGRAPEADDGTDAAAPLSSDEVPIGGVTSEQGATDPTIAVDRGFAREGTVLWERELAPAGPDDALRAAGTQHVLVGDRVVQTDVAATANGLTVLPGAAGAGALDSDGGWAVAEFGTVVRGGLDTGPPQVVTVEADWVPTGSALAFFEGDVVFLGEDGTLGRVANDGELVWRTSVPVVPDGPVGERWLAARDAVGADVTVSLEDGGLGAVASAPLAFIGDVVVLPESDGVVARDLRSGAELWERPDEGYAWRVVADDLVAEGAGEIVRVDPATGAETGRVSGFVPAATAPGVVSQQQSVLVATGWDGAELWRRSLDPQATHAVKAVDDDRVAVRSTLGGGSRITVLAATDGAVLTVVAPQRTAERQLVRDEGTVTIAADDDPPLNLALATGDDVDEPAVPGDDELTFTSAGQTVRVEVGTVTVRGIVEDEVVWTSLQPAPLSAPPIRTGTTLVVTRSDGSVAAIDPRTGDPRWERDLGVLPTSVAGDGVVLLVGTVDGQVLRLDPDGKPVTSTVVGTSAVLDLVAGRPAAALLADRVVGFDVTG